MGAILWRIPPRRFTAIVHREGDFFVAVCPELHVVSQGRSVEEATANLEEAVDPFLEHAAPEEIASRLHGEVYVASFDASRGYAPRPFKT